MREAAVAVFTYDELSDEAKKRALAKWREREEHHWGGEVRKTIEAFEKEFGVDVKSWQYSPYNHSFSLDLSRIDGDVLALKGNRARAWFWNNHAHVLLAPTRHYWTHDRDGKLYRAVAADSRVYQSKVFYDRVYDGTCPLTGVCFDNDALDPLAYFCFGTYWDEDKQARLQSHVRTISADDCNTVRGILRDCVESLFKAAENDWRDQESEEYFRDFCEANEWEFTEDGDRWLRKEATTRTASA